MSPAVWWLELESFLSDLQSPNKNIHISPLGEEQVDKPVTALNIYLRFQE